MPIKGKKSPRYIDPPEQKRWNWYQSEIVIFPTGREVRAHRHPNGGGWVDDDAYVSLSVYVDCCAVVEGRCVVTSGSHIGRWAIVKDNVIMFGTPNLTPGPEQKGHVVEDQSITFGSPTFRDFYDRPANQKTESRRSGRVFGDNIIMDQAKITEDSDVFGNYKVAEGTGYVDIEYPSPHQGHSITDPIRRRSDLDLRVQQYDPPDWDWRDILRKNKRDNFECGGTVGPVDGGKEPSYYSEGGPEVMTNCDNSGTGSEPTYNEVNCNIPTPIPLDGLTGPELAAAAAYNAGFRGQSLGVAIAVAGGESSYNPGAVGDRTLQNEKWGPSVGMWQVRTLNDPQAYRGSIDAGRDTRTLVGDVPATGPAARPTEAQINEQARMAFRISNGGANWKPWSVYTAGIFCRFTAAANQGIAFLNSLC